MRKWVGNLAALALGLAVALLLAEVLVGVAGPAPPPPEPPVRSNRLGYRDADHEPAKPPGVVRIAFVGDSYTRGARVREEDRFSNVVTRRLDDEWPQVSVEGINFGKVGADTINNLEVLRKRAPEFDPDAIVYGFVLNDFADKETLDAYHGRHLELERAHNRRWGWLVSLSGHSKLAGMINTLVLYRDSGQREAQVEYLTALYEPGPLFAYMSETLDEAMAEVAKARRGVVVFFPYLIEGEADFDFYVEAREIVRGGAARHSLSFIEVLPHLAARPYHEWWASEADHHPNAAAHEIVAALVVETLLRGEPLVESPTR